VVFNKKDLTIMANGLVKILTSDSGEKRIKLKWHLIHEICGGNATLCGGEYFGLGESGCDYKLKTTKKGGITCEQCLKIIKEIKAIKL
jgi:hypothetical protein